MPPPRTYINDVVADAGSLSHLGDVRKPCSGMLGILFAGLYKRSFTCQILISEGRRACVLCVGAVAGCGCGL